jgi:hypothetical protein
VTVTNIIEEGQPPCGAALPHPHRCVLEQYIQQYQVEGAGHALNGGKQLFFRAESMQFKGYAALPQYILGVFRYVIKMQLFIVAYGDAVNLWHTLFLPGRLYHTIIPRSII